MRKRILSLFIVCVFCLMSLGVPAVLASERISVIQELDFYNAADLPIEEVKVGKLTAKITLRGEVDPAPSTTLVLVGYQEADGVKQLYSVDTSPDTVLERGEEKELFVSIQITNKEIEDQIRYKALVWEGGFIGDMTPVVDYKSIEISNKSLTFTVFPEFARVTLKDTKGKQVYPNDGVYELTEGETYTYLVENIGYESQNGVIIGGETNHLDISLTQIQTDAGKLMITTPDYTVLNDLEPVQLNALVLPFEAGNREITWSIKSGSEDKVELRVPDSQADGFINEAYVKPGVTSGEATFIATREETGETEEITLQIGEAVRTVKLTGIAAKAGSSLPGKGDDQPTGPINVGTKYVTAWSAQTDYIYWSGLIPKDGIDYKVQLNYSSLNPVNNAYVILKIKEILSTETGEDGGQQYDIIGDTLMEYHIFTPKTASWGEYVKVYSSEVIGNISSLEKNKRYRFELSRPVNSSAINFDELILMPADYDPDAKPIELSTVTGVRTDAGNVEADGKASVNLYWNAYSGAQEYQIFIDNAQEPAITVAANTTQTKIEGLTQHEVYKFAVKAKLADGTLTQEGVIQQNSTTPHEGVIFYVAQETTANRDWRMEWFRKAKYGMMITWDPSAVFEGEYTGRQVGKTLEESRPHYSRGNFPPELIASGAAPSSTTYTTQGYAEWIMNYAKIPREIYLKAAKEELAAGQYDFGEWVRIAKESGMRYLTIITKHHDGFAIMDTNGVGYNIMDHSAGQKDVFGEIVRECRRQGMGIGAYYSQSLDWLNNGGLGGIPELSGGVYPLDAQEKYVNQVVVPHLQTLMLKYNVDYTWWDMGVNSTEEFRYRTMKCIQALPGGERMVFNGRLYSAFAGARVEDFSTPEQNVPGKPANGDGNDWEACMTTNMNWGHAKYDVNWKSEEATLFRVVNITSKGGNFLYNVGPLADGSFPQESTDRLLAVGSWLKANGESIYDTTPAPFTQSVPWGRITRKTDENGNTVLYLIVTKRELITPTSSTTTKVTVDGITYETDNRGPFYTNQGGPDGAFDAMDEDMWRAAWPSDGKIRLPQMFNEHSEITVCWLDPSKETLGELSVENDSEDGNIVINGLPAANVIDGAKNPEGNQYISDKVQVQGLSEEDYAAVIKLTVNGPINMERPAKSIKPNAQGNILLNAAEATVLQGVSLSNGGPNGVPILGNFGAGGYFARWIRVEVPELTTYKVKGTYQTPNNNNISFITVSVIPESGSVLSFEGNMTRVAAPNYGEHYFQTGGTPNIAQGIVVGTHDATITLPAGRYTIELKRGITGNVGTWFNVAQMILEKQQ